MEDNFGFEPEDNLVPLDERPVVEAAAIEDNAPAGDVKDLSMAEAVLRGAGQGATLGFSDELEAAARTALDSEANATNFLDKYYAEKANVEARQQALKQEYPTTSLLSELAGGVAVPGGAVAKGASGASKLLNLLKGAAGSALAGGTYAAGTSQKKALQGELPEVAEEAGQGALIGGALGAAIPAAVAGGGAALSAVGGSKIGDLAKKAYKAESAGKRVVGKEAKEALEKEVTDLSESSVEDLTKMYRRFGDEMGSILDNSKNKADISEPLNAAQSMLAKFKPQTSAERADLQKLISEVGPLLTGERQKSLRELKRISDGLKDMTTLGDNSLQSKSLRDAALSFKRNVDNLIEESIDPTLADKYKQAKQGYSTVATALEMLKLDPTKGITEAGKTELASKMAGVIRRTDAESAAGEAQRYVTDKAMEKLASVPQTQSFADEVGGVMKDTAERYATSKDINRSLLSTNPRAILGATEALPAKIAAYAGRTKYAVKSNPSAKVITKFADATDDQLNVIKQSVPASYSNVIDRAMSSPPITRKALLYSLIQQPGFRGYFTGEEQEQSLLRSESESTDDMEFEPGE